MNIDHVLDNPASGTAEVTSHMQLADALSLSIVESFTLGDGDPHFVAYRPDGLATVYRIHSDCAGWTSLLSANTPAAATAFLPASLGTPTQKFFIQVSG